MRISPLTIDRYISFAVLIQSTLVIFQILLVSLLNINPDTATLYRVLLTAIPLSIAIVLSFRRNSKLYIYVYALTIFILCLNLIFFPQNERYLSESVYRFLLPTVIPSALCLMTVSNINIVEDVLYLISWITSILVLFYVINFVKGTFTFSGYDMSFSYALLLPMISLYSRRKYYSVGTALFLFITVLAIGSRGAAFMFVIYVVYDVIQSNKKLIIPLIILGFLFIISLPLLMEWLEGMGITSRTLNLLMNHDLAHTSGREKIYQSMIEVLLEHPLTGVGLFGDRYYLGGAYTHNIILEIFLNWGGIIGTFIILFVVWVVSRIYLKLNKRNKNILFKYSIATVAPLMFSGSYLTSYSFGVFIGIVVLMNFEMKETPQN